MYRSLRQASCICPWALSLTLSVPPRPARSIVKQLLERGADIDATDDREGYTPLMQAAKRGFKSIVQDLLARGADASIKDKGRGWTALMHAVDNGDKGTIEALLQVPAKHQISKAMELTRQEDIKTMLRQVRKL